MYLAPAAEPRLPLTPERQRLAAAYLPMARALARPFKMAWAQLSDEFDSAACLALVEAAETFDPGRNVKFATFARARIWGALRDAKRRQVPLGYRSEPREAPRVGELPMRPEEVGRVVTAEADGPVGAELEAAEEIERWLSKLPRRHSLACRQIYVHDMTYDEAARSLGCSQSRVAYMHRQAMDMLAPMPDGPARRVGESRPAHRPPRAGGGGGHRPPRASPSSAVDSKAGGDRRAS